MTTRQYELLAYGLAACLVVTHIAIKPRPEGETSGRTADMARRNRAWRSRVAPVFELPLRDGSTFRLADYAGRRVVILTFFTTWCDACQNELPDLQRYVGRLQIGGQPILAVAIDGQERPELVDRFSRRLQVTLPLGIDDPGVVTRAYEVSEFPTTVVIGAEGRVLLYQQNEIPNPEVAFDAVLEREFAAIARSKRTSAP